ncbi:MULTISPECIES: phosphatase PAP2 family protein [Actinoplanes]|uniref:phosphatase PAP2 family protein n=1 Tax=Actinoplanes TaxID=1865 RepID=UPI0005F2F572|nr:MULTISPECIES: phosphatase PAP2 family protein [Actinoplanes]
MRSEHKIFSSVRTSAAAVAAALLLGPFLLTALMVVAGAGPLHDADQAVTDRLHAYALAHPGWVETMAWWSLVFDPNVWRLGSLGLVGWLWWRHNDRLTAIWVTTTMIAGGLLGVLLKLLIGRHRPEFLDPVAQAAGLSFPSGHALNNALGAAVFLLVLLPTVRERPAARVLLWTAAILIPLVTAYSRVLLGVHWTSDVLAGLLVGLAVPAVTVPVFRRLAGRRSVPESVRG